MDLDEIEAGALATDRGGGEVADHLVDLVQAEHFRHRCFARQVEDRLGIRRDAGRRELIAAAGLGPAVPKLDAELGVIVMHCIDQPRQRGEAAIVIERQRHADGIGRRHHRRGADCHHAGFDFGALGVIGAHLRSGARFCIEHHAGRHAGHHDPVADLHRTHGKRLEQVLQLIHFLRPPLLCSRSPELGTRLYARAQHFPA
jgi:hypothetical protein